MLRKLSISPVALMRLALAGAEILIYPTAIGWESSDTEEENKVVKVNLQRSEEVRRWWPFLRDRRIDAYGRLVRRFID